MADVHTRRVAYLIAVLFLSALFVATPNATLITRLQYSFLGDMA